MIESSNIHLGFFFPSEILSLGVRGLLLCLVLVLFLEGFLFCFGGGVGIFLFCFLGVLGGLFSKTTKF